MLRPPCQSLRPRLFFLHRQPARSYHSLDHGPPSSSFTDTESTILSTALEHVPATGFTSTTLLSGLRAHSYPDISHNLFPRGAFSLVLYHLEQQRTSLSTRVDFSAVAQATGKPVGMTQKIRSLAIERLRGNEPVIHKLPEALALMSLMENIPDSVKELGLLSDEIWACAGDTSVDTSWYTKRASLMGVYAATEVFMTQDQSTDFRDTWAFLDRRLEDVAMLGKGYRGTGEYLGFTGMAAVNILRSKNVRLPF